MDHYFENLFHVGLCYAVLSAPCILVITCWERADLLALLCIAFSYGFVTFHMVFWTV